MRCVAQLILVPDIFCYVIVDVFHVLWGRREIIFPPCLLRHWSELTWYNVAAQPNGINGDSLVQGILDDRVDVVGRVAIGVAIGKNNNSLRFWFLG